MAGFLACLWNQPDGVAEVALSVLPHASLMRLVSLDVIRPVPTLTEEGFAIVVTAHGWEVIRTCADERPSGETPEAQLETPAKVRQARAGDEEPRRATEQRSSSAIESPPHRPVVRWFEDNAGLVSAIGLAIGVVVAVVIALAS